MRLERVAAFVLVEVLTWCRDHDASPDCHAVGEEGYGFLTHEVLEDVRCDNKVVTAFRLCHSRENLDRLSDDQVIVDRALEIPEVWRVALDSVDDNPVPS